MCYNSVQLAEKIYKDAVRLGATEEELNALAEKIEKMKELRENNYHASGFNHSLLKAFYVNDGKLDLDVFSWGLIPFWTKTNEDAIQISMKTINARGETMFDKASFRDAAMHKRCVIPLEGYFEHHHKSKKTFPYYIHSKNNNSFLVGGILSTWLNPETKEHKETVAIVTSKATEELKIIHNNPKLKEPRMPLILDDESLNLWLKGDVNSIKALIQPNENIELEYYTVRALSGKMYVGNNEKILEKFSYPELEEPWELF